MVKQFKAGSMLATAVLLGIAAFGAQARIYKWVDEDGMTHYTQSPPPAGIEGKTMSPPPDVDTEAARARLKQQQEQAQKFLDQRQDATEDQQKKQQDTQAAKQRCEEARTRLQSFQNPRVNFVDKDGTRRRATEEERQRELQKARDYLDKNCK